MKISAEIKQKHEMFWCFNNTSVGEDGKVVAEFEGILCSLSRVDRNCDIIERELDLERMQNRFTVYDIK